MTPKRPRKKSLRQVTDEDIAAWLAQEDAREETCDPERFSMQDVVFGAPEKNTHPKTRTPQSQKPLPRGFAANIDKRTGERWRKASLGFDVTLDLHGYNQEEALEYLKKTVERAYHSGARRLLVITGKGLRGGGVLRPLVAEWIAKGPLTPYVVGYDHAPQAYGGTGAWMVYLKRKRHE